MAHQQHNQQASFAPANTLTEDRREFLQTALSAAGLAVCGATLAALGTACQASNSPTDAPSTGAQATLDVAMQPRLASVGGAISQTFGSNNGGRAVIVIRTAQNEFLALSSVCTHEQCTVGLPTTPGGDLQCPCHGARFSSRDGRVTGGPAPAPLQRFQTSFNASSNILTITF